MSIRDQLETRAKTRASCRASADEIVKLILTKLDGIEDERQGQVLAMVISELQAATRREA